jgi:Zn-dependent oligopeptidase
MKIEDESAFALICFQYFSLTNVLNGLHLLVNQLFGMSLERVGTHQMH